MITLRRSSERHYVRHASRQEWSSFQAGRSGDSFALGFGALERFDEHKLEASASLLVHPLEEVEVISCVLAGVVASRGSARPTAILRAGDIECAGGGDASGLRQRNLSRSHPAHVLQLWLRHRPARPTSGADQRHFSAAERRGALCLIAAGDGREGAIHLRHDVLVYSAILEPGKHVVHELGARRSAWLHIVQGEVRCEDMALHTGDAASFALERAVSVTARQPTELLIVNLAHLASAARA